jgi:cytochrome c oxidase subunit 2
MNELSSMLPVRASEYGSEVDTLLLCFGALTVLLSAPVFILMAWFAFKYRRGKPAHRLPRPDRNIWIEISWSVIPFVLILVFYVWAARLYFAEAQPPAGALEIDVVAKQWMWKFQHPGGQREINELHVPVDQPVKLTMASEDVIHSLYIPALRLKRDLVPGRYETMWFEADRPGTYVLTCAEFCGTDHSVMGGRFIVMKQSDYAHWLEQSDVDQSLVAQGAALFRSRGCSGCHGNAATVHAPRLEGLYGSAVPLQDGTVVTADDQYIRDSILLSRKQIAADYPAIMPVFQNVLSEDEVLDLVAYIKSLAAARHGGTP